MHKHTPDINCSAPTNQEWKKIISGLDVKSLYIGGVFALSHRLDFDTYANNQLDQENYLSVIYVVNGLGSDKRELAVVGKELLEAESCIKSLPVKYYYSKNPQVNYSIIVDYLNKWDCDLSSKGKSILLVLNIPEKFKDKMHFKKIRLVSITEMKYIIKVLDKIVESFKYNYKRLQIRKKSQFKFFDYLHMTSMAWCNVPCQFIQRLSFPPEDGSLYLYRNGEASCLPTLSQCCKMNSKALNFESGSNLLDKYTCCDEILPCLNYGETDESTAPVNELLLLSNCKSTSTMESYQAMKRLVSYLQGANAGESVLKYAKLLENHLEYRVLFQIHQYIAD